MHPSQGYPLRLLGAMEGKSKPNRPHGSHGLRGGLGEVLNDSWALLKAHTLQVGGGIGSLKVSS